MTNYFIHFNDLDLSSLKLYSYEDGASSIQKLLLENIYEHIYANGNIYIMLPSALFGFKKSDNSLGLKDEVLQANILSEIEDRIISDVSTLKFYYHKDLELASWIDSKIIKFISNKFNDFDGEVFIFPEHFLCSFKQNTIHISHDSFICSFKDMTGFSGSHKSLSSYISILKSENINLLEFKYLKENDEVSNACLDDLKPIIYTKEKLHADFLSQNHFKQSNFFKRKLSLSYFKSKLKLTYFEAYVSATCMLVLFFAPLGIPFFINSSIESYQVKTLEIFRQLDPNFKRIVNARAQVDALTREIPQQNYISNQDLELLQYLEQLNDESVQEIKIDLLTSSIDVLLDGLSSYKLQLIKELFTSESLIFSDDALVEKNNKIYGNLRVTYD